MNTLPDYLIDKIMMYNRHPLAEIFHDLYEPYREALLIQKSSPSKAFREAEVPSFLSYKKHGVHCAEWDDIFYRRMCEEIGNRYLILHANEPEFRFIRKKAEKHKQWREERAILELFIYRDTSI